jgi:hypothetical protein
LRGRGLGCADCFDLVAITDSSEFPTSDAFWLRFVTLHSTYPITG